jgi:hypothetical protein
METLPIELIEHICHYASDISDVLNLEQTCTFARHVIHKNRNIFHHVTLKTSTYRSAIPWLRVTKPNIHHLTIIQDTCDIVNVNRIIDGLYAFGIHLKNIHTFEVIIKVTQTPYFIDTHRLLHMFRRSMNIIVINSQDAPHRILTSEYLQKLMCQQPAPYYIASVP